MSKLTIDGPSNFLHKIYVNDPLLFKSYINKKVTITTEDSKVHTGIVYTVDPVTERLGFCFLIFSHTVILNTKCSCLPIGIVILIT